MKKEGFRFRVSYQPSGFWVVLAVAMAVAYVAMIFFPTLPAATAPVPPLVAVEEDRAAAVRADIPKEEWMYDSTGTYNVPGSIAPADAIAFKSPTAPQP